MEDTHSPGTTSKTQSTTSEHGWSRQTPQVKYNGTRSMARTFSILNENSCPSSRRGTEGSYPKASLTSTTRGTRRCGFQRPVQTATYPNSLKLKRDRQRAPQLR